MKEPEYFLIAELSDWRHCGHMFPDSQKQTCLYVGKGDWVVGDRFKITPKVFTPLKNAFHLESVLAFAFPLAYIDIEKATKRICKALFKFADQKIEHTIELDENISSIHNSDPLAKKLCDMFGGVIGSREKNIIYNTFLQNESNNNNA